MRQSCRFVIFSACCLGLAGLAEGAFPNRDRNKLVFEDCDLAYHQVIQTVKPGEKFEIFCMNASRVIPSVPSEKICQGREAYCNDTNSTDYRTIFPDAPADFQFWSGGDTIQEAGFLHIPDKVKGPNPVISLGWVGLPQYAYDWKAPVSNITLIVQANSASGLLHKATTSFLLVVVGLPVVATLPALVAEAF